MENRVSSIFSGIPRGVLERKKEDESIPNAAWANPADIADNLKYSPDCILLGAVGHQLIGIKDDRHMITVAGSRAGKGVSVIIPNLIHYQGSVLVIDPKGELASITALQRAKGLGQKVCVLDPFNRTAEWVKPYRASFNPLSILTPDNPTILEDAGLISDALVAGSHHSDPHWDDSAKSFIEGVILHVVTYGGFEGIRDLVTVHRELSLGKDSLNEGEGPLNQLIQEMYHNAENLIQEEIGDAIKAAAMDFDERPPNEKGSVLSTIRRHIRFLGYGSMQSVLQKHDFDLSELKTARNGMTIYLCLPAGRMGTCNRWLRMFVNLTLEAMEREKTIPYPPVLLCLDEFPVLGHMKQIEDAAGQIAGFGVKLWPIIQDLSQLKTLYSDRWETFMGNAGIIQFFGNNDLTTLDFIEKRLGKTSLKVRRESYGQQGASSSDAFSYEIHPLMTAAEAGHHFAREDELRRQLILWPHLDPIILQRVVYHDGKSPLYPHFKGKFKVIQ